MFRLTMLLFSFVGPILMGMGMIVVLAVGLDTGWPILLGAAAGVLLGLPASWLIARQIRGLKGAETLI